MSYFNHKAVSVSGPLDEVLDVARAMTEFGAASSIDIMSDDGSIERTVEWNGSNHHIHMRLQPKRVPRFRSNWSGQMLKHIECQPNPREYVRQHIGQLCDSWGDPNKPYAVDRIVTKYELGGDEDVQNVMGSFFV